MWRLQSGLMRPRTRAPAPPDPSPRASQTEQDFSVSPPTPSCQLLRFSPWWWCWEVRSPFSAQTLVTEWSSALGMGYWQYWNPTSPFPGSGGDGSTPGRASQVDLRMLTLLCWALSSRSRDVTQGEACLCPNPLRDFSRGENLAVREQFLSLPEEYGEA